MWHMNMRGLGRMKVGLLRVRPVGGEVFGKCMFEKYGPVKLWA